MKKGLLLMLASILTVSMLSGCGRIKVVNDDSRKSEDRNESVDNTNSKNSADSSDEYILPSDTEVINEIQLSKLNETELRYAYAEVFARHGKAFEDANWTKYFNSKSWYVPNPSYRDSDLSTIEKDNANYIKKYIDEHIETTTQPVTQAPTVIVQNVPTPTPAPVVRSSGGDSSQIIPDSSSRRLTASELSGYSKSTLALIRNEIYARNGYVFQKQQYRDYFGSKSWYYPNSGFNESWLNSTEKYNIQLIKSME